MGSPRTEEILEALRWLSLTPGARTKTPPPGITPLSEAETAAVREALEAAEMGIDVERVLAMEAIAERLYQSPRDRKLGRIAAAADLPHVLEAVRMNPWAINSHRIRRRFMKWLWDEASDHDAGKAFRYLREPRRFRPLPPEKRRLCSLVGWSVDGLMEQGMSAVAAVLVVSRGDGPPAPTRLHDRLGCAPPPAMPLREAQALFRLWKIRRPKPPERAPHKRPGRNKRGIPGNPVYSGPKTAQEAGFSTLPPRPSTDEERGRDDQLPHDNRSRRPAQGAAANPPRVAAQRKGAAVLKAVREPGSVRGGGDRAIPRGKDVRSHGRRDDPPPQRPGRVKRRPPP